MKIKMTSLTEAQVGAFKEIKSNIKDSNNFIVEYGYKGNIVSLDCRKGKCVLELRYGNTVIDEYKFQNNVIPNVDNVHYWTDSFMTQVLLDVSDTIVDFTRRIEKMVDQTAAEPFTQIALMLNYEAELDNAIDAYHKRLVKSINLVHSASLKYWASRN